MGRGELGMEELDRERWAGRGGQGGEVCRGR